MIKNIRGPSEQNTAAEFYKFRPFLVFIKHLHPLPTKNLKKFGNHDNTSWIKPLQKYLAGYLKPQRINADGGLNVWYMVFDC